jgi:glyoxylase-like metal-dependent hydrolase (beta-lactamase superfamily II)
MSKTTIYTIDLNFQSIPGAIAVYLIPHQHGAILVESGPGSTTLTLQAAIKALHYEPSDITDVFLTHIHLDHSGAAGWLAQHGARIHVHPNGALHLANPEKLLASATRIFGDRMNALWGEFIPVPEERLSILQDGDRVEVGGLCLRAIETPGHADHHHAYRFEDVLFTGDVCGVRLGGQPFLRLPMPSPEFNLDAWQHSLDHLRKEQADGTLARIAPTHFGIYHDPDWLFSAVSDALDEVEAWMEKMMPANPEITTLRQAFTAWNRDNLKAQGISPDLIDAHETVNPAFMSADGIQRYWQKFRKEPNKRKR